MRYLILTAAMALAASAEANALGSLARVTVVDRDSGATLRTYYSRGEYWVAGNPGARYAIEIRNAAGGRLLAVTSVDGVNVLSGETAGWDQAGYVFDPGESYQITGWRKSNAEVAAFTFTDSQDSYAGRTGRPANVGVIGIALFREQPQPVYSPPRVAPAPAAAAPGAGQGERSRAEDSVAMGSASVAQRAPAPVQRLGTGHGQREYSYAVDTEFHRMQAQPNEVIRVRYDSFENLVAVGIIRQPHPTPRAPDPFPGSEPRHFVPDPPG
ncbi:MAG TPA: hypothetical protein VH135_02710 [Steroidobacteraceae bacterium]|nr:hypothetical protein [Steroidobacteraceae bacterium]